MDNFELKSELEALDQKYSGTDYYLGAGTLTNPDKLNAPRGNMFASHLSQFTVLNDTKPPKYFTNYENVFGEYSTSFTTSDSNYRIIKKISKFNTPELKDHIYFLLVYNEDEKVYHIIHKQNHEKLTEKYGYLYKTDPIDNKQEGDIISKDEILYNSTSFDEYGNYGYGINALTVYMIEDYCTEDAITASESFRNRSESTEIEEIEVSLNDNDILINLCGDSFDYKCFYDIGETIENKIICSKRRINRSQSLYDLKKENLMKLDINNDVMYFSDGVVKDIDIFCNKDFDDIPDKAYYKQIKHYYRMILDYHEEIVESLGPIIESGNYTRDLAYVYDRSKNIFDSDVKWRDDKGNFSNMIIRFTVYKTAKIDVGSKITGRYGDKGIISRILPDELMPRLEDGRVVDLVCAKLGVPNRENPAQLYEVETNFLSNRILEKIRATEDIEEKQKILFKYISILNKEQYNYVKGCLSRMSEKDKIQFFEELNDEGIHIHNPPINDCIRFDQIAEVYKQFPDINKYQLYVRRFGRDIPMLNPMVVGEKYVMKLKHHPKSKFIIRNTGYINPSGFPEKSMAVKKNQNLYSNNPIRIGEMENNNLMMGMEIEEVVRMNMLYRNSIVARRSTGQLYTDDILDMERVEYPEEATNRNAEIFRVYMKSVGLGISDYNDVEKIKKGINFRLAHKKGMRLKLLHRNKGLNLHIKNPE